MRKLSVILLCLIIAFSTVTMSEAVNKRPWDKARAKTDAFSPYLYVNTTFYFEDETNGSFVTQKALDFLRPESSSLRKDTTVIDILRDESLGEITTDVKLTHVGTVEGSVQLYHKISLDGIDAEDYSFYRFEYTTDLNTSLLEWITNAQGLSSSDLIYNFTLDALTMRWIYQYEESSNNDYLVQRPDIKVMKVRLATSLYNVPLLKEGKIKYSEFSLMSYVATPNISINKDIVVFVGTEYYRPTLTFFVGMFIGFTLIVSAIILVSVRSGKKIRSFRGRN